MNYYPKRPVTSFQDLEVYQKLLAIAVVVVKHIPLDAEIKLVKDLHETVLSLPIKIGEAHSLRFGDTSRALSILEEIMVGCNKTIAYLELYRDLYNTPTEYEKLQKKAEGVSGGGDVKVNTADFFDEQINNITSTRFKVLHLQRSWKNFTPSSTKTEK